MVITDFDIPEKVKKRNVHTPIAPTYKMDYGKLFAQMDSYTLIEKRCYSCNGEIYFNRKIDNRVSTQILYKEFLEDIYIELSK